MILRTLLAIGVVVALAHAGEAHEANTAAAGKRDPYRRTVERYRLPDVTLTNQDGQKVRLHTLADFRRPVVLNFVFTSCTTICGPMAATFAQFQTVMDSDGAEARLISISLDPDHDTPAVMKRYRERFGGRPGWELLTGRSADVLQVTKALDAYADNKMNHYPLTFLRPPGSETWIRIRGLVGTAQLISEYRRLVRR